VDNYYKKLAVVSVATLFFFTNNSSIAAEKVSCDSEKARQLVTKCVNNKEVLNSAKGVLQKLTEMSFQCPGREKYLYFRGQCYEGLGRNQEALKDYADANKLLPDDIVIKHALARIYYKEKNYGLAIEHATDVIQLDETEFDGFILRAKIYEKEESFNLALKDYSEALIIMHTRNTCSHGDKSCYSPIEEEIYLNMFRLHIILDETNKAIHILKEGLKWNPGSSKLMSKLRKIYKETIGKEMKDQDYCP